MHDLDRVAFELEALTETELGEWEVPGAPSSHELEMANEFLEISSEQELEQFLGGLISNAGRTLGVALNSPLGRQLTTLLKNQLRATARQALPVVGRAIGDWVAPGTGGAHGAAAATSVGKMFGLELEGLSAEDREFEVARRYVNFANTAARQMWRSPRSMHPRARVRHALTRAARQQRLWAGGEPPYAAADIGPAGGRRGRWTRSGGVIVVHGL